MLYLIIIKTRKKRYPRMSGSAFIFGGGMTLDPGQLSLVELRASAILLAAGAWDVAPTEIAIADASVSTLLFSYTRGGAAGAFDFRIEVSPYATTAQAPAGSVEWIQTAQYAGGVLAAGADTVSFIQRERITYTATGAAQEAFVYGPLEFAGTVERLRINAAESGNVGAPGTLQIQILTR